jgi:hypothetical protein
MNYLLPRQVVACAILCILLIVLIIRLVQKGRLDIAYCWVWLGIGAAAFLTIARYDWLLWLSDIIGSKTATTTLFLLGFFVILLMCLQFSLVISAHRRQIKKLSRQIAIITAEKKDSAGRQTVDPKQDCGA